MLPRERLANVRADPVFIAATADLGSSRDSAPSTRSDVMLGRMAARGGTVQDSGAILAQLRENFGLDQPLIVQYLLYLRNVFTLRFSASRPRAFPDAGGSLIANALPGRWG